MTVNPEELRSLLRLADNRFFASALYLSRGELKVTTGGDGNDFLEFSSYREGDDVKAIDWRASAKSGGLMLRRNRSRAAGRWSILVDASASMRFGNRWQCATDLASAFAAILLHQGNRVGMTLFDVEVLTSVPPRSGFGHLEDINNALNNQLPVAVYRTGSVLAALEQVVRPSGIIVLSDIFWGDAVDTALRACGGLGGHAHMIRLASPEDTALQSDTTQLEDAETGALRTVTAMSEIARKSARQNLVELEAAARKTCQSAGVLFSTANTEDGWRSCMLNHIERAAAVNV